MSNIEYAYNISYVNDDLKPFDDKCIESFISINPVEDLINKIELCCYFGKGKGFTYIENGYYYRKFIETKGLFGRIKREERISDDTNYLKALQEQYKDEDIKIVIVPWSKDSTRCNIELQVSDAYAKKVYMGKKRDLMNKFAKYNDLYSKLFDYNCLDKRQWYCQERAFYHGNERYVIEIKVEKDKIGSLFVHSWKGKQYEVPSVYSIMYRPPQLPYDKEFKSCGMKNIDNIWDLLGFIEAFSGFIVSKIGKGAQIRIKTLRIEADYSKTIVKEMSAYVYIFIDENPIIEIPENELKSW